MKTKKLLQALTELQFSIIMNERAFDDDLAHTWNEMKMSYEYLKDVMEKYIEKGESYGQE